MTDIDDMKFKHVCEVCEVEVIQSPEEAFNAGWDYPPRMGAFGIISPRTCGNCGIDGTVWWAVAMEHKGEADLTAKQIATIERIAKEPESILGK